jgi:protocatechuate 3,4-dioxygenase beta subunit
MPGKTSIFIFTVLLSMIASTSYAGECIPTSHRTTGTHYEPVTRQQVNISQGMTVRGQILAMPDCLPVKHAKVAHWQAGENGFYQDRLRAFLYTDEQGRFEFKTEWPNINPPHIHFIVTANQHEKLETQWVGHTRKKRINFKMVLERE